MSDRPPHSPATCARKVAYETRPLARRKLWLMRKRAATPNTLRVYRCPECRLWHLGNIPGGREA